jgi:hypothetical protein
VTTTKSKAIIDGSDALPLIIGVSVGAAFAAIVIGISLACVCREKQKKKELEAAFRAPELTTARDNYSAAGLGALNSTADITNSSSEGTALQRAAVSGEYSSVPPLPDSRQETGTYGPVVVGDPYDKAPADIFQSQAPIATFNEEKYAAQAYPPQ